MARINCGVTNCSHNNNRICYSNVINVGGKSAKKDSDTSCASFLDETVYSHLTNNINQEGSPCTAITCNVATCNYNSDNLCNAESIKVNGEGANLYTETECSTFKRT